MVISSWSLKRLEDEDAQATIITVWDLTVRVENMQNLQILRNVGLQGP